MSTTLNKTLEASIERESGLVHQEKRSAAIEQVKPSGADPLLALMDKMSQNPNITPEMVGKMMNVYIDGQRKMATMTDEREFFMRLSEFKKNPPEIVKRLTMTMKGTAKGSGREYSLTAHYADLNAYSDACMAGLAEKGITWDFEGDNTPKECWARCVLHYGLFTYRGPKYVSAPETSGVKNDLQAQGSAGSYLMRYSFCGATGMTAALPPDKNGAVTPASVTPSEPPFEVEAGAVADFLSSIEGAGNVDELWDNYERACEAAGVQRGKDGKLIPGTEKDASALEQFTAMRRKRAAQLEAPKKAGKSHA